MYIFICAHVCVQNVHECTCFQYNIIIDYYSAIQITFLFVAFNSHHTHFSPVIFIQSIQQVDRFYQSGILEKGLSRGEKCNGQKTSIHISNQNISCFMLHLFHYKTIVFFFLLMEVISRISFSTTISLHLFTCYLYYYLYLIIYYFFR